MTTILKPVVTEKATNAQTRAVYTFAVDARANKVTVARAVQKTYGLKPMRVNIVNMPGKKIFMRGKLGHQSGYKKAIVFLKAGEKINL